MTGDALELNSVVEYVVERTLKAKTPMHHFIVPVTSMTGTLSTPVLALAHVRHEHNPIL